MKRKISLILLVAFFSNQLFAQTPFTKKLDPAKYEGDKPYTPTRIEWLLVEYPDRAAKVIKLLRSMHGGQDYVATFGLRQRGQGPYAALIGDRFRVMSRRLGLNASRVTLRTDLFRAPVASGQQMQLL